MARTWFSTLPDKYYLKLNRKGHRYEVLFTALVLGGLHFWVVNPLIDAQRRRALEQQGDWKRTTVGGNAFVIHPQEKVQLKFLA